MTWGIVALAVLTAVAAWGQRVGVPTDDLTKLGVDELFSIEVTSVGRKAQKMSKSPAAVFVLTAEDIRRSGAVSLPEALRWVPGLTVLSSDERSWLISARGSSRLYADKILLMVDGRSLYTPLFSGVIWDAVDVPLGDIERIEIVRGPGAVMWGPNAVNGVINIITKNARQTKGVRGSVATGNALRGSMESRYGDTPNDKLAYRVWGKLEYQTPAYGSRGYYYLNTFFAEDPEIRNLDSATGRLGYRIDYQSSERSQFVFQGDIFKRDRQDPLGIPGIQPALVRGQKHTDYAGGYMQGKWTLSSAGGGETILQLSYDKNQMSYPYLSVELNNFTFDVQRRVPAGERNEIYVGAGFQQYWDHTSSSEYVSFDPSSGLIRSEDVVLRDEWQAIPGKLTVSGGVRLDYFSYTHLEYQPSIRLLYTPDARRTVWLAVSRAVRTPNRFDRAIHADNGVRMIGDLPMHESLRGSAGFRSEVERSLEAGYRMQSGQRWSMDVSGFWSRYDGLRSVTASIPSLAIGAQGLYLEAPAIITNGGTGRTRGGEVSGTMQVLPGWRVMPAWSYARDERSVEPGLFPGQSDWDRRPSDLRQQGLFRSQHDLARNWQLDLMARARGRDHNFDLPGVLLFDARLAWQATRGTEISVTVHNLTNRHVLEAFAEGGVPSIPVRRTVLFQWVQRF